MESYLLFPTTITSAFVVIALIFLIQILIKKSTTSSKNKKPPPQAKGSWPIIGHLHRLGGLPHRYLGNMADVCGPVFTIKLGAFQALVVSDSEIAKECFTINDKVFASRPKSLASAIMGYNYAMFPLSPYGEYWRQMRKMVSVELLSQKRVDMLKDIHVAEVRANMKCIYDEWQVRNKETGADSVKVEMIQLFNNLVLNIITRSIAGKRFAAGDEESSRIHEVVNKFHEFLGTFVVSDFIPSAKVFDLGGYKKSMTIVAKEMDSILDGWLVEKKKRRESGEKSELNDFMDVLISRVEGASKDEFPGYDHDTIIRSTSIVMIAAGSDSTAVTLTWALVMLLNNPKTLKKAQDELDFHVGRDRLVDESDLQNLVYLHAIIKETLRLYPPASISITHQSTDDCIVSGYNVSKGTLLITNLWKLHRDPNVWSNPYEFQPERFLTDQKGVDLKGQHYELLPFGSGRRMCPGIHFALKSLYLTLASLMQGFEIAKPSNEPIDTTEIFRLANLKATAFEVLLTPRLSANMYHADA